MLDMKSFLDASMSRDYPKICFLTSFPFLKSAS